MFDFFPMEILVQVPFFFADIEKNGFGLHLSLHLL